MGRFVGRILIFLCDGDCWAQVVNPEAPAEDFMKDGITERNIDELVKVFTDRDYHVTVYRVGPPRFHART